MKELQDEMLVQNNRSTSFPIFIVVEDKKVYWVSDSDYKERKDDDYIDPDEDLCESCLELWKKRELPLECDAFDCDNSFIPYRIEKDVPNLRAAFFFTAEACDEHIAANRHHYNSTVRSYAISAYHNEELKSVMRHLSGKENL